MVTFVDVLLYFIFPRCFGALVAISRVSRVCRRDRAFWRRGVARCCQLQHRLPKYVTIKGENMENEITLEDLKSYAEDSAIAEEEAKIRAEKNECICGTVNCSTEYSCYTSGY